MQEIEIADLKRLTQLIKDLHDYDFSDYAMSSFKRRVQRILELYKFTSFDALLSKLSLGDKKFFNEFLSEITVNVTEMFRDPSLWVVLREIILPEIFDKTTNVNIWHAGCSSGEEVVSMTILLSEMGLLDNAKIVATDIDMEIIKKAKQATYPAKNMELSIKNYERANGKYNLEKYLIKSTNKYVVDEDLLKNVKFKEHNLATDKAFAKFDLILCRNVMIYFNQVLQNNVLKVFHESLYKHSFLAVGSKESLIWCEVANKFVVENNEEKIYKKVKD